MNIPDCDAATRARLVELATAINSTNGRRRRLINDCELDPGREAENAPAIAALDAEINRHIAHIRLSLAQT